MLTIFRRHGPGCKSKSRTYRRCSCPIWIDGTAEDGRRIKRQSLKTRLWAEAERRKRQFDSGASRKVKLSDAISDFLSDAERRGLSWETLRKYRRILSDLIEYADRIGIEQVDGFAVEEVRHFASKRGSATSTGRVELERLSSFFKFCERSGWIRSNPAASIQRPKVRQRPTEPFSTADMTAILAAAVDPRDRTFLLVGRYSGLRISDVATLGKSRINDQGMLLLYTQKTGQPVHLPLPGAVVQALLSIRSVSDHFYFWTGDSRADSVARSWSNRLRKVFDASGVKDAHFHRLRDTFAVELLLMGTPMEDVSILLGHSSIRVTEKHYAPWVKARQQKLEGHVRQAWKNDPILNEEYILGTAVQ